MFDNVSAGHQYEAQYHFEAARRAAFFEDLTNLLLGRERYPLAYEQVRRHLPAYNEVKRGQCMIPLDKIVGSVGRYRDFTRSFLPLKSELAERWKRLDAALNQLATWPPIEVYQVGDRYFVQDGNHRVSVARANGLPEIEATVTEIQTAVQLNLDRPITPQLLAYERTQFLAATNIEQICGANIQLTELGGYAILLEHIRVHCWYMGEARNCEVAFEEAVENWCHDIYRPLVRLIDRIGLLREVPGRTPGDLYIWLTRHMHALRQQYGDDYSAEAAAEDLKEKVSEQGQRGFFAELAHAARGLLPGEETPYMDFPEERQAE
jgi:hypothetical protein